MKLIGRMSENNVTDEMKRITSYAVIVRIRAIRPIRKTGLSDFLCVS